jgi:hypothetical protein
MITFGDVMSSLDRNIQELENFRSDLEQCHGHKYSEGFLDGIKGMRLYFRSQKFSDAVHQHRKQGVNQCLLT